MIDTEKEIEIEGEKPLKKARENPQLEKQANALKRLVSQMDIPITKLAEQIGVDRQSIYMWQRGIAAIPEDKLKLLADFFEVDPIEIRYDVMMFSRDDLIKTIEFVESELSSRNLKPSSEIKARIVSVIYETLQEQKKALSKKLTDYDFETIAKRTIKTFA